MTDAAESVITKSALSTEWDLGEVTACDVEMCELPAEWLAIMPTCAHKYLSCTPHMEYNAEVAKWASKSNTKGFCLACGAIIEDPAKIRWVKI